MTENVGGFRILRELGQGATATVYLAQHPDRADPVAIKMVRFDGAGEGKWTRRMRKLFLTEGAVTRKLDHPGIVKVYATVIEESRAYIVMEYVSGRPLSDFCTYDKLLPLDRVVGIIHKCCLALDHAFRQGIVHRDIKPANIVLADNDDVKIMDFGLGLNVSKGRDTDSTFVTGVGSPAYMSPEQIKAYPLNQKTDLYSLGVVLFHLLTGRLPFRADNPAQLIYKIINTDPPAVSQLNPAVPALMDSIVRKALEKDLYSRYSSGWEFAQDLSMVRYRLQDDGYTPPDTGRFDALRRLDFFRDFEDLELWETLRVGIWRECGCGTALFRVREGEGAFGVVIAGEVELSMAGRVVARIGAGEAIGEGLFLDTRSDCRHGSLTSLTPLTYVEICGAALVLASDECREQFRKALVSTAVRRLEQAYRRLAPLGRPAGATPRPAARELPVEPGARGAGE